MGDKDLPFFVQSNFLLGFPFYCNPSFIKKKVNVNELDANKWLEVIPNRAYFQFAEDGGFTLDRPRPQTNFIHDSADPFRDHHHKSG